MSYEAARLPGGSPCDYSILRSWEFSDCCCNIVACQQRVTVRCVADLYTRAREEDMGDDESPDQRKLEPGSLSLPGEIELASHPNPLSASTTISYALPADGDALVEIFDIQGRKIATVASGQQQAGYHGVVWNGNDSQNSPVVSGIYFCRLQFEDRPSILEKLVKF